MNEPVLQRAEILMQQSRHTEAISLLEDHLAKFPEDIIAKYYYISSLIQTGQKEKSRNMVNAVLAEEPDSPIILGLAAQVSIAEEKYADAESFAHKLIAIEPLSEESHILLARVKLAQRNYDKALASIDHALSLDPENVDALNLKTFVAGILNNSSTQSSLEEALKLDPENPFTIANQGLQLLREGKVTESLERLKYALSINPTNELARFALPEAIKSRFFIYRFFFKYKEWTSRLTATQMWIFLLGTFFGFRLIRNLAKQSPELAPILMPIIYILFGLIILTWITSPVMNLFLLLNRYGKVLLDDTEKSMARYTGLSLLAGLVCLACYFASGLNELLTAAILCLLFVIPLGTFLHITKPSNQRMIRMMTIGIVAAGVLGTVFNLSALTTLAFIGIFIYQWVYNGMMIKEGSRTIDN